MQSWGASSKFYRKTSLNFPSKSAIIGMLLSAAGRKGEQVELLAQLDGLDMKVVAYSRNKEAVSQVLEDFQIIGGGYDGKDPWQKNMIPKKGDGGNPVGAGTKLAYKYYLQDVSFGVLIEIPNAFVDEFSQALIKPVYDVFLGRKGCIPTDFVFRSVVDTADEGLVLLEQLSQEKKLEIILNVAQGAVENAEVLSLNDQPVKFGLFKEYKLRTVSIF